MLCIIGLEKIDWPQLAEITKTFNLVLTEQNVFIMLNSELLYARHYPHGL